MSAEGSSESVDKAKNILTSTIASLVILFAGYLLLNALNPDIIQFQTIQPPSVVLPVTNPPTSPVTAPGTGNVGTPAPVVPPGTPGAPSGCSGCVSLNSLGIPTQSGTFYGSQQIATELQALAAQPGMSGVNWAVSSAYRTTQLQNSTDCHQFGTCVDVVVSPSNDANWIALCNAAQAAGFSKITNEADNSSAAISSCGSYATYTYTSGANIHLNQ